MKPADFEYFDPTTVTEAIQILAENKDDAKVLAGGQSLVPVLNMRLARPRVLVDINQIRELAYVREERGGVAIGALARHAEAEHSDLVTEQLPLLAEALSQVAHPQIRNRGTVVGSLVHADPASELPAVAIALGAEFKVAGLEGTRIIPAADFFVTYFTTVVEPGELVTEVWFPRQDPAAGSAFVELARRHGDFAIAGVAVEVLKAADGTCARARIALTGVADRPVRAEAAERLLAGGPFSDEQFARAAEAVIAELDPTDDVHATAEYRKEVAGVLVRRSLAQAAGRAR